jgi:hypothetical protein
MPKFDPSILRHSEICGAADEAVLNNVHKKEKNPDISRFNSSIGKFVMEEFDAKPSPFRI